MLIAICCTRLGD